MADILASPYFAWLGIAVAGLLSGIFLLGLVAVFVMFWLAFKPKLHLRAPKTDLVFSTYDADVRTGEGNRFKIAADLRVARIVGLSWRDRWVFGLLTFAKDRP